MIDNQSPSRGQPLERRPRIKSMKRQTWDMTDEATDGRTDIQTYIDLWPDRQTVGRTDIKRKSEEQRYRDRRVAIETEMHNM